MKKKGFLGCLLGFTLCILLSCPAAAAEIPASGQVGNSSIRVSIHELSPGYYLGAVWDGTELLTLFDATVDSDGVLEQSVDVGKSLNQNDRLTVGISGENAGTGSVRYPVTLSGSAGGSSGSSGSSGGSSRPSSAATVSGSNQNNSISIPKTSGGTISVEPSEAAKGKRVTVTALPDAGYMLDQLAVYDPEGNALELTDQGEGRYTFTMPDGKVSIDASFRRLSAALPFVDLRETDWFYSAVQYVYEHEMMSGVTPSYFDPEGKMTRAMLVSVFYRMRGGPAVSGVSVFPDVPAGAWFTDAVIWAVNEGVVSGYGSGLFGPNDNITREQLAVILWRFAGSPAPMQQTLSFADSAAISDYAQQAMCWAVEQGVLNGSHNLLAPGNFATRAEVAQMLKNYLEQTAAP